MTPDQQSLKNDVTNISIFTSASEFVDVLSFFSLMSFTSALIDAGERVQVDKDSIFVFKGVLPPFEQYTSVNLSFPHFFSFCKLPSQRYKFPQDDITQCHDFYVKFSVSMVMWQDSPLYMVFLFGSTYPLISGPRQRATLLSSTIRLSFSLC